MRVAAAMAALCGSLSTFAATDASSGQSGYKVMREVSVPDGTEWDYLTIDPDARHLYITNNWGALVFDIDSDKFVGEVRATPVPRGVGLVHGVAISQDLNRGFLSNEMPPSVVIFDLKTLAQVSVTPTDSGTDAVVYDAASKRVFAFNGKTAGVHDVTVIDASSGEVIENIPLPGIPEFAVSDDRGHVFVNIENRSEIARIDTRSLKIAAVWPITPCDKPGGLAIDAIHRRLFVGCDNKIMAMVDADTGKVIATIPSGDGTDATGFDPGTGSVFSSNGEGTLTVAHEDSPESLTLIENVKSRESARTLAIDPKTHRVFLMAGKFKLQQGRAKPTPYNPHGYPTIVSGSATLLIVGR